MRGIGRLPEPDLPPYIDETMTYMNLFNNDIYIFEQDGEWNEQTSSHPKLSLEARLNERDWFEKKNAYLWSQIECYDIYEYITNDYKSIRIVSISKQFMLSSSI